MGREPLGVSERLYRLDRQPAARERQPGGSFHLKLCRGQSCPRVLAAICLGMTRRQTGDGAQRDEQRVTTSRGHDLGQLGRSGTQRHTDDALPLPSMNAGHSRFSGAAYAMAPRLHCCPHT